MIWEDTVWAGMAPPQNITALAGRTGEVLISPAPGRPGRVAVTVSGQVRHLAAHSDDALHPGDAVIVIGQEGGVLDVKLWDGA
ncbi:hypothetical protein DESA109040_11980 [Deinococcus saxicola]|uniref:hypothetical protein n=1 Tax=Deinococcus saxicola TaxID=249406 RepID=UPI0039EF805D